MLYDEKHKWHALSKMIQSRKIGILCTQETHLSTEQTDEINNFHKNIKIFSTLDPLHPNSKGVAVAFNKKITNTQDVKATELIPGRAILIETQWHNTEVLTILAIYAPNDTTENMNFWNELNWKWTNENSTLPFPDLMLGDLNLTEDAIDRSNGEQDPPRVTHALSKLKDTLSMVDGWRQMFPYEKTYTLQHRSNNHRS
jgi:exonuclease III